MNRAYDLLIVDDDSGQAQLVGQLFKELGLHHRCHHVSDGLRALDFLNGRFPYEGAPRPYIILLDLNLPGMSGCELLSKIKQDPLFRCIPVIMLSQSLRPSDVNACYDERANAYIGKPTDLEDNLRVLRGIDHFWGNVVTLPR